MATKDTIRFYTAQSPNGHKVAITLEELGLRYDMRPLKMPAMEHKEPWFLAINPNGRIPALQDTLPDGIPIDLFESGSIQHYLVDRYDVDNKISYPRGTKEYYQTMNWLFFQNANIGPIQGQVNHFYRYSHADTPQTYAKERYMNEARRLWRTVDKHFSGAKSRYLVGDKCTIADIALCAWAKILGFACMDQNEFPHVSEWLDRMMARPAVQRGLNTPAKVDLTELEKNEAEFKEYIAKNEVWIRKGMEDDKKKV